MIIDYKSLEDPKLFFEIRKTIMMKILKENIGKLPSKQKIDERDAMIYQEYLKQLKEKKEAVAEKENDNS